MTPLLPSCRLARPARLAGLLALAATLASPVARAAPPRGTEKGICLDAMGRGQTLRDAHKLVEAREQFRICARLQCPVKVQQDCGPWLAEADRALPTVVMTAWSDAGTELYDVTVTVDGQPLLTRIDGRAVPVNAGFHVFHFEAADYGAIDRRVLVKEGGKDQSVTATMVHRAPESKPPVAIAPPPPTTAPPVASTTSTSLPSPTVTSSGASTTPLRNVGYVVGAVGLAGLATGAVAGILALSEKSRDCQGDACASGTVHRLKTEAVIADVGFVAGGVLTAAGLGLVLFAPHKDATRATAKSAADPAEAAADTSLRLAPYAGGGGAGLVLGRRF